VSTQAPLTQPLRRIEPLRFVGSGFDAMQAVLAVLARLPRVHVLERDAVAVHAVMRTALLRIPTDLELVVDEGRGRLDLRASTPFAVRERASSRAVALDLLQRFEVELRSMR